MDDADANQDTEQPTRRCGAIRPVTIRQLSQVTIKDELKWNGPEPQYSLNGEDFGVATFVGYIVNVALAGEINRRIRIDDGTGWITTMYAIREEEEEEPPGWGEGAYARVFGVPREFGGGISFNAHFIRPVEDPHEVIFHFMEAIAVTLQFSRGQPPPRPYDSQFVGMRSPVFPPPAAGPDSSVPMRSPAFDPPPFQSQPFPGRLAPRVGDDSEEDPKGSVNPDAAGSAADTETAVAHDTSDDDGGSTEYYTDGPPDSPHERSPSPTPAPVNPLAKNHSFEGHLEQEAGPSSQSSEATQRPVVQPSVEGGEDGQTPRGKSQSRTRADPAPESSTQGSDDELETLRGEFLARNSPTSPPRMLKPDPYAGWSPAKRKVMVSFGSKAPGEEIHKRILGEGITKLEMRNALRELAREGKIETIDGINYRLVDEGPRYPRF